TLELPVSGARVIAVSADGLGVPWRVVEQNHSPALDRVVPDDTGIAADTLVLVLPFKHQASPRPASRNRESSALCLALARLLGNVLRAGCAHSQDAECANNLKNLISKQFLSPKAPFGWIAEHPGQRRSEHARSSNACCALLLAVYLNLKCNHGVRSGLTRN